MNPWTTQSRLRGSRRATATSLPSRASISKCAPARCSDCSAPTARARPPRSRFWRACARAAAGASACSGSIPKCRRCELKDRVGVCLQATNLQEKMKVREAIELFASLYTRTVDTAQLLKRLQLWEKRESLYIARSPADRSSGWRWPWRCSTIRRCSFSTSPPRASIRRRAWRFTNWCRTCAASSAPSC